MRDVLVEELGRYKGHNEEMQFVRPMIDLLQGNSQCFFRDDFSPGHMTGSGLLMNARADKVLLNRHAVFDRWVTFGGHADGEENIREVALREAVEESGIRAGDIEFVTTDFFDIDIHPIAANEKKQEPAHYHFDVGFLFQSKTEEFLISNESTDLRWCNYDEAMELLGSQNDPRMLRIMSKWKNNFYGG